LFVGISTLDRMLHGRHAARDEGNHPHTGSAPTTEANHLDVLYK